MRSVIIFVVFTQLSVYGSAVSGVPGTVDHRHSQAIESPAIPMDPDDDEDEHRVRPRRAARSEGGVVES